MFNVDLSTCEYDDHVVVALRGELDMADAASIAAAQQHVLRVLAITRLAEAFSVHPSVDEATGSAGHFLQTTVPGPARHSEIPQTTLAVTALPSGDGQGD